MRTLSHNIDYESSSTEYTLYHLTDLHMGARACDETRLKRDIQAIADDPNARWIGGGDYIDAICQVGDKRYKPSMLAKWVLGEDDPLAAQARYVVQLLTPIAGKCLGLVKGNHEWAAEKYYAYNIYWTIVQGVAEAAGVTPNTLALGASGFVAISFRRKSGDTAKIWRCVVYLHHGYGGGRLPGGHALALGRVLGDFDCDIALLGHRHTQMVVPKMITRSSGCCAVRYQTRLAMFTPSYLAAHIVPSSDERPVDTYAEEMGLPPQPLGTMPVRITPAKRRIEVTVGIDV